MKNIFSLVLLGIFPIFLSCSSDDDGADGSENPGKISVTATEKSLVENSNNSFAINLFKDVRRANGDVSFVLSPLSVTCNMSMFAVGANGATRGEIMNMLGYGAVSIDDVNAMNRKFLEETPALDRSTKISIANLLLSDTGFDMLPSYPEALENFYMAEKKTANFSDMAGVVKIINDWCKKETNGMIPELFANGSNVAFDKLALLNAVYFKGMWANKFDKSKTKSEAFRLENNQTVTVNMMRCKERFLYNENENCQMVNLPYGNGSFSMVVMLPKGGRTLAEMVEAMSAETWHSERAEMEMREVDLKLPRFTVEYNDYISNSIMRLGAQQMFSNAADFSNITSNGSFKVGFVKHAVKITVDEDGTEAAAVTGSGEVTSPGPDALKTFYADHPFVYAIIENSTGQIYFIGTYMGNV